MELCKKGAPLLLTYRILDWRVAVACGRAKYIPTRAKSSRQDKAEQELGERSVLQYSFRESPTPGSHHPPRSGIRRAHGAKGGARPFPGFRYLDMGKAPQVFSIEYLRHRSRQELRKVMQEIWRDLEAIGFGTAEWVCCAGEGVYIMKTRGKTGLETDSNRNG